MASSSQKRTAEVPTRTHRARLEGGGRTDVDIALAACRRRIRGVVNAARWTLDKSTEVDTKIAQLLRLTGDMNQGMLAMTELIADLDDVTNTAEILRLAAEGPSGRAWTLEEYVEDEGMEEDDMGEDDMGEDDMEEDDMEEEDEMEQDAGPATPRRAQGTRGTQRQEVSSTKRPSAQPATPHHTRSSAKKAHPGTAAAVVPPTQSSPTQRRRKARKPRREPKPIISAPNQPQDAITISDGGDSDEEGDSEMVYDTRPSAEVGDEEEATPNPVHSSRKSKGRALPIDTAAHDVRQGRGH